MTTSRLLKELDETNYWIWRNQYRRDREDQLFIENVKKIEELLKRADEIGIIVTNGSTS